MAIIKFKHIHQKEQTMNKAIQATICGKVDNENTNLLDKFFEIPPLSKAL